ncbi:hypothetical protein EVAR_42767_1 [Eumeta japonica]|uniref:Uncharacterized protein n=1 Tax=Eumeta variegata TaxID=151549 RepID=A0A4C1WJG4_EUMVA|nr:hypothetical protein EVAR_42767_1 [Eumeta japonica]
MKIDNYDASVEYRKHEDNLQDPAELNLKWYSTYVRKSEQFLQVIKCADESRSNSALNSVFPDTFLPPPCPILQASNRFVVPSQLDSCESWAVRHGKIAQNRRENKVRPQRLAARKANNLYCIVRRCERSSENARLLEMLIGSTKTNGSEIESIRGALDARGSRPGLWEGKSANKEAAVAARAQGRAGALRNRLVQVLAYAIMLLANLLTLHHNCKVAVSATH